MGITYDQICVQKYVASIYTVPFLRTMHPEGISKAPDDEQYRFDKANHDAKYLSDNHEITLEFKHEEYARSTSITCEILCNVNQKHYANYQNCPLRITNRASKQYQDFLAHTIDVLDDCRAQTIANRNAIKPKQSCKFGLMFTLPKDFQGDYHYTQFVRHYPNIQRVECWLLDTKRFGASLTRAVVKGKVDIGRTDARKHGNIRSNGEIYDTINAYIEMPSCIWTKQSSVFSGINDGILGNWEIPYDDYMMHRKSR